MNCDDSRIAVKAPRTDTIGISWRTMRRAHRWNCGENPGVRRAVMKWDGRFFARQSHCPTNATRPGHHDRRREGGKCSVSFDRKSDANEGRTRPVLIAAASSVTGHQT